MKVLVADAFETAGLDGLRAAGCTVLYEPEATGDTLTAAITTSAADVLVVRSTQVTAAMFDAGHLALVVRAGAGVNTIDVAAASERGIYVSNCPGRNSIAVAELAFGLILALDRRIPDNVADLRANRWNKKEYSRARGLFGRSLSLLGFGSIGQEMARRASAFGMPLVIWSPRFQRDEISARADLPPAAKVTIAGSPEEAAERCDVLSVHLALTPDTRGRIGASVLDRLRPGSYFINTARGELVDYQALASAVTTRNIRVGLDVFPDEPSGSAAEYSAPLVDLPGVYGTHHIGASTAQAQDAIAAETVRIVATYKATGKVPNVVNLSKRTPATHMLVVRHRDRPGVLAHVFEHLRGGNLNVQETENEIFEGAAAAVARINLDGEPSPALLRAIAQGNQDIVSLHLVRLGGEQPPQ